MSIHTLHIPSVDGDRTIEFDPAVQEQMDTAVAEFRTQLDKGLWAAAEDGKGGGTVTRDPKDLATHPRTVMHNQTAGG